MKLRGQELLDITVLDQELEAEYGQVIDLQRVIDQNHKNQAQLQMEHAKLAELRASQNVPNYRSDFER